MTVQELDKLKETKEYKACIRFMHPTIQQNLFRLIREIVIEQASNDRYFDDRNIASHNMAVKMKQVIEDSPLPLI